MGCGWNLPFCTTIRQNGFWVWLLFVIDGWPKYWNGRLCLVPIIFSFMGIFGPVTPSWLWMFRSPSKKITQQDIPIKIQKTENSNLHGFELHRPLSKGIKVLFQIIKAIINQSINHRLGDFAKDRKFPEKEKTEYQQVLATHQLCIDSQRMSPRIDWCCLHYFIRNRLVALQESLFAGIFGRYFNLFKRLIDGRTGF